MKKSNEKLTADDLYRRGNDLRRQGLFHEAINSYLEAERLDPDCPAAEARHMLEDILNFYCKDMYNP